MIVEAHGIGLDVPDGWEARIYRRPHGDPTLHAANFALPPAPDPVAYRNLIDWNAEYLPAYRTIVVEDHVDPSLMAELERSGFLRSLGGGSS